MFIVGADDDVKLLPLKFQFFTVTYVTDRNEPFLTVCLLWFMVVISIQIQSLLHLKYIRIFGCYWRRKKCIMKQGCNLRYGNIRYKFCTSFMLEWLSKIVLGLLNNINFQMNEWYLKNWKKLILSVIWENPLDISSF